jgi:hypothetical protein
VIQGLLALRRFCREDLPLMERVETHLSGNKPQLLQLPNAHLSGKISSATPMNIAVSDQTFAFFLPSLKSKLTTNATFNLSVRVSYNVTQMRDMMSTFLWFSFLGVYT